MEIYVHIACPNTFYISFYKYLDISNDVNQEWFVTALVELQGP